MSLPSIELLESRHEFPCPFTFKVIGDANDNFTARVISAIRDELKLEADPPFSIKNTTSGRHVSVTVHPDCDSAQQVLAIYSRISQLSGLVMLL